MIRQKPMYTPSDKETGKEKLKDLFSALTTILIAAGIIGMLISIDSFAIAVKPAMNFEDIMNFSIKPGDHIEGKVLYTYGCFAESSVISAKYGKKTGETKNGYYYAVPDRSGVVILSVPTRYYNAMETLTEETFEYLYGGGLPQINAQVNGYVVKNDSESLQRLLKEYLEKLGYTAQEIADMGEIYIIKQQDHLTELRNIFIVSVIALFAGLVLLFIRKREKIAVFFGKNMNNLSPEKEARLGNMLVQVTVDKRIILKRTAVFMTVGLAIASMVCYYKSSLGYLAGSVIFAYIAAVVLGLFPLTGSREYIIFYEHGMNYCGEAFLYEESGYPDFQVIPEKNGQLTVFLKLRHRIFNVSNMEDFVEKYKNAYKIL